jgi:hypothetical protein
MEIVPLVAPFGTVVEIWLASVTLNVAAVPLNFTPLAPVKFVPVNVTPVPTCPLAGEKLVIVGAATLTVKFPAEVAIPCGVTTDIFPVTAPVGTVAVMLIALATENVAATPPIVTEVAPVKFVPVKLTAVPVAPLVGVKLLIVGVADCCGGVLIELPPPHPTAIAEHMYASNAQAAKSRSSRIVGFFVFVWILRREEYIASSLAASRPSARGILIAAIQRKAFRPHGRYKEE